MIKRGWKKMEKRTKDKDKRKSPKNTEGKQKVSKGNIK